jgi:tryptophan-rich sensory protein
MSRAGSSVFATGMDPAKVPVMYDWYTQLNAPPLTPPGWVFGPVWTFLYACIAVAIFRFYRSPRKADVAFVSVILALHLAANFTWTSFFFGLRMPWLAFADILFLDATLVFLLLRFRKADAWAGALLAPYLCWVSFATYLNLGFALLN